MDNIVYNLFMEYTDALVNEFDIDMGRCEEILAKILKKDTDLPQNKAERKKCVFILNPDIKKHVHEETGMIIKNCDEKKIIGKLHNNQIVDLTRDDIEICIKWSFKVDESQLDKIDSFTS